MLQINSHRVYSKCGFAGFPQLEEKMHKSYVGTSNWVHKIVLRISTYLLK